MTPSATLPDIVSRGAAADGGDRPLWALDGRDWPLRETSLFVDVGGQRWHVQRYGQGPDLLLLHGTAAATHSWRALGPRLAERFRVTALDLPGHGFSGAPAEADGFTQGGMARAVAALLATLQVSPEAIVGHSAGAALGAALCLDGWTAPRRLVSLNGALSPRHAFSGSLFPLLARLASLPAAAQLFAWQASGERVEQVIESTGSHLDAEGLELYRRLFARRSHVSAAFTMMADWNREPVLGRLHRLACPLTLVTAAGDRAVAPAEADAACRRLGARAEVVHLSYGGHLVHEEAPGPVADLLLNLLDRPEGAFA